MLIKISFAHDILEAVVLCCTENFFFFPVLGSCTDVGTNDFV